MKNKAYINICMLLFLLSGFNVIASAQVVGATIKESDDSTYQKPSGSINIAVLEQHADNLMEAIQTRACVNVFTNQTVSSSIFVQGCNTLTVQNVTVVNGGHLSLSAPVEVLINGPFDVLLGGVLDVGGIVAPPQTVFNYTYDNSGNRITRGFVTTSSAKDDDSDNNKAGFEVNNDIEK